MVSNNTPLAGLVWIIVVVMTLALVAGLALARTDLLNPQTSAATADAIYNDTRDKALRSDIARQNYEAQEAAKTQAEQEKLRLEVEAQQRKLDQDLVKQRAQAELELALARLTRYIILAVGTLITLIISIGLVVFLIQYGRSRLVLAQAQATQVSPWRNLAWRSEQIRRARAIEVTERETALTWRATHKSVADGDDRHSVTTESVKADERRAA